VRQLNVFNFLTLNGFYKGVHGDLSWHRHGEEEAKFSQDSLGADNALVFGRVTYQMMAAYWPTPLATQNNPAAASAMNAAEKIVFSRTLSRADWSNTTLVTTDAVSALEKLKETTGRNMTILGSGTLLAQLADAGLIDNYQFMIDPVVLGEGTPAFSHIRRKLDLRLTGTRTFKSGVVLLTYALN
jgi:dihydrofolate reductase